MHHTDRHTLTAMHTQTNPQVFALEAENKKLTRALVREVGEEVPLARVLDDSGASDWKGRREQVIALRDQVGLAGRVGGTVKLAITAVPGGHCGVGWAGGRVG